MDIYVCGRYIAADYDYDEDIITLFNAQSNAPWIFSRSCSDTLGNVLLNLVRKIDSSALKGRTDQGVGFELICHFVWYTCKIKRSSSEPTDCGASSSSGVGIVDYNAYVFEKNKSMLSSVEMYLSKGKIGLACAYLMPVLAKVFGAFLNNK